MTTAERRFFVAVSAGFFVAAVLFTGPAVAQAPEAGGTALVQVMEHDEPGAYPADGEGISLYLFERDTLQTSTCYGTCADLWPPFTTDEAPDAGAGVNPDLLDTITREDGTVQVTYHGWLLYDYGLDQEPGDIEGHGIEDHGAEWYLISPERTKVEGEDHPSEE